MKILSREVKAIEEVTNKIKPDNLVLSLNYSPNWLHSHISGYIAGNKPLVILENYEAQLNWFPVKWNLDFYQISPLKEYGIENKNIAMNFYVNKEDLTCFSLKKWSGEIKPVKYVFLIGKNRGNNDEIAYKIKLMLKNNYFIVGSNSLCRLYELK